MQALVNSAMARLQCWEVDGQTVCEIPGFEQSGDESRSGLQPSQASNKKRTAATVEAEDAAPVDARNGSSTCSTTAAGRSVGTGHNNAGLSSSPVTSASSSCESAEAERGAREDQGIPHNNATPRSLIVENKNHLQPAQRADAMQMSNNAKQMSIILRRHSRSIIFPCQGYDYTKSTEENYAAVGGVDDGFHGNYAVIREKLDYQFHKNYTRDRQLWQDQLIQRSVSIHGVIPHLLLHCTTRI